jgi:hypothetical protein
MLFVGILISIPRVGFCVFPGLNCDEYVEVCDTEKKYCDFAMATYYSYEDTYFEQPNSNPPNNWISWLEGTFRNWNFICENANQICEEGKKAGCPINPTYVQE